MEAKDFRSYDVATQEAFRFQAVRLVVDCGYSQSAAAKVVGVSRQVVNGWVQGYRQGGEVSLKDKRTNEHRQGKGALTAEEARQLRGWIRDKCPPQLKLPFALWNSRSIKELIARKFGKDVAESTIRNYMKQWGYTPQKPLSRAAQRDPVKVRKWLEEDYPEIAAIAKKEGALILWGDETCIKNHDQVGRSYAPEGQTPVHTEWAEKFSSSMISAVSNRGDLHFMLYDGGLHVWLFIRFLKLLLREFRGRKLVLIVDNLRVHHARIVRKFLEHPTIKGCIRLEFLPPYAPEYNPDEYLNNDLKQKLRQKPAPNNRKELLKNATESLKNIGSNPHNITAYFNHKDIKYAA